MNAPLKKHFVANAKVEGTYCGLRLLDPNRRTTEEKEVTCLICARAIQAQRASPTSVTKAKDPLMAALSQLKGQCSQRRDWKTAKLIEDTIKRLQQAESKLAASLPTDNSPTPEKLPDVPADVDSQLWRRLRAVVVSMLGVRPEEVQPEARFVGDLGADSLDTIEIIMAIEEEFRIEIPDEEAEKVLSVQEAYQVILQKLSRVE